MKNAVGDLTKSLNSYNPTVNEVINGINKSFQAVGFLIITMLMAVEMLSWYRYLKDQNGGISIQLYVEISMKYVIACFLVIYSGILVKEFLWFFDKLATGIGTDVQEVKFAYSALRKGNWAARNAINAMAFLFGGGAILSIKIIAFLRFIELFVLKAVSPLMIAFWMADSTRPIAVNFLKRAAATAFQAIIIIILILIWQGLKTDSIMTISHDSFLGNLSNGIAYLGKCITFIFLLFGSQRTAKSLFQVN
ncbi:hypothetical protein LGW85_09250 [Streptococcus mutans]|nr:hypothetical protein [Streptococcus mutans]MCB5110527.1 hypothetical protein [Streptococcus mutans]MCB5113625.1 hypothetical protein [Streptococcus mutans]